MPDRKPFPVLMICPFARPNLGGVESHISKLTDYLTRHDHSVTLLTYQPLVTNAKGPAFEQNGNLTIHRVPWFGRGWFNKLEPYFVLEFLYLFPGLFVKSLFYHLRHHREYEVIHAHGFVAGAIVRIMKLIRPKRIVMSTHAIYDLPNKPLKAALARWLLSGFDFVLAVGEPSREELIKIGIEEEKAAVHPNWIDLEAFSPLPKDRAKQLTKLEGKTVVLYCGRLIAKKGVLLLLDVAAKLRDITFVFLSAAGEESGKVETASKAHENIVYLSEHDIPKDGPEKIEALRTYYAAADLFAVPSLYAEGFATVMLEGVACGTPIIVTNQGVPPTIFDDSVGRVLDPTVETVTAAIRELTVNNELLRELQSKCRPFALKHFSEQNAGIIAASYRSAQAVRELSKELVLHHAPVTV